MCWQINVILPVSFSSRPTKAFSFNSRLGTLCIHYASYRGCNLQRMQSSKWDTATFIVYSIYTSLYASALNVFSFNKRAVLLQAPETLLWYFYLTKYKAMGPDGDFGVFNSLQCMRVNKSALIILHVCIHVRSISENTMLNRNIIVWSFSA